MKFLVLLFLVVMCNQLPPGFAIKWLALSRLELPWNISSHCSRARRHSQLVSSQVKICRKNLELMPYVTSAATKAIHTCQQAFSDRRWNCSSITTAPKFTPDLTTGTREQAFVSALSSAALMYSISRACSAGLVMYCGCAAAPQEPPHGDFKWGGCGDNVRSSLKFSKMFTDSPWGGKKKRGTVRAAVNVHNNLAGRKVLEDSLHTQCKCHGISGSCNVRTCWKALPQLSDIASRLKQHYAVATEVINKKPATRVQLVPVSIHTGYLQDKDLVFTNKSPDYCSKDPRFGSVGTKGRECNTTSDNHDGCDSMCCGRGFRTSFLEVKERCHCKYYWCCYVKCKVCSSIVQVNTCL